MEPRSHSTLRRRKTVMDPPHPPPSSSSATASEDGTLEQEHEHEQECRVSQIGDDLLECILVKLPAKTFAYAACVSRSWNSICGRVLSRPKLASALSLNSSLSESVNEVVAKVISEPIRPNFAILYVYRGLNLKDAHDLLCKKLGMRIPIIACNADGLIGRDVLTGEIKEALVDSSGDGVAQEQNGGIMLTIGYLPGIKVKLITLMGNKAELFVDRFALDIREFSSAVSGCASPEAVIIFGDPSCDLKSVVFTLDHAFSRDTIIVGNETARFISRSSITYAAALVFARDKCKPDGLGEIQFHYALSSGIVDVGQTYKAVSVKTRNKEHSTWLTAKVEGNDDILDGNQVLGDFAEMGSDLYIGVRKKRRFYTIDSEKVKSVTCTEFHSILGGDEEYLYVCGLGIKTGDLFWFYTPSVDEALASSASVSRTFQKLAEDLESDGSQDGRRIIAHSGKEELFGTFIFSCCGRGEPFFGKPNVDSSPVVDNFPGVPVSGMFCGGEIGRGPLVSTSEEHSTSRSCSHVYSAIYMLLSYKP